MLEARITNRKTEINLISALKEFMLMGESRQLTITLSQPSQTPGESQSTEEAMGGVREGSGEEKAFQAERTAGL